MAFVINLNTPRYVAQLAVSSAVTTPHMLVVLAAQDADGHLIDFCDGNIKAAFSMLITEKLFTMQQALSIDTPEQLAVRFNSVHCNLPTLYTGNNKDWAVKVINLKPSPLFVFSPLEEMA